MLRAFFLAIGIYCFILGAECLVIDRAILNSGQSNELTQSMRDITPAEWAPWSLMSVGAVVILYSFTIPKKMKG